MKMLTEEKRGGDFKMTHCQSVRSLDFWAAVRYE
jgi:hypothetical protein